MTACSGSRLCADTCVTGARGRQKARACVQCQLTTRKNVRFAPVRPPKRTLVRVVPADCTQKRAFRGRAATRMHAGACSASRPHAMACVSHDGDGAANPARQAQGRRGRRRGSSLPNRGHVFEIPASLARGGGMAPHKAAGHRHREWDPVSPGAHISNTWAPFRSERGSRHPRRP